MSYCHECRFFSDLGRCRNGAVRRSDVGFFQKACDKFLPPASEDDNKPLNPKTNMKEENIPAPAETEAPKTKKCRECGRELPISEFGKNVKSSDGHLHVCKECNGKARTNRSKAIAEKRARRTAAILFGNGHEAVETPSSDPELLRAREALRDAVAPAMPKQSEIATVIRSATSKVLIAELARRGWKGTLTLTTTANLNSEE